MKPYIQTTPFTTAAASLLTILSNLTQTEPTKENEFKIWQQCSALPTRACSIFALANYAKQINPTVIVGTTEYNYPDYRFDRYTKNDIQEAAFSEAQFIKQAKQHNIPIIKKKLTLEDIKTYLKDNILMVRTNVKFIRNEKRNSSCYIVITIYNNKEFSCIDPAIGGITIPEELMQESFSSLKEKKYRDHRIILFPKKSL